MEPTLILGIGNILLRDEGVGVRVVECLQQQELPEGVAVADGGTCGMDLVDLIADRVRVVVVDAVDVGRPPGTVVRFTEADLMPSAERSMSMHDIGFFEALMMARQLGCAPREVVIIGIQPADVSVNLGLSPAVERAMPDAIAAALAETAERPNAERAAC